MKELQEVKILATQLAFKAKSDTAVYTSEAGYGFDYATKVGSTKILTCSYEKGKVKIKDRSGKFVETVTLPGKTESKAKAPKPKEEKPKDD